MDAIFSIGNIFERIRGSFGIVEGVIGVVVVERLLVFLPGLHFASITFFSKCEI